MTKTIEKKSRKPAANVKQIIASIMKDDEISETDAKAYLLQIAANQIECRRRYAAAAKSGTLKKKREKVTKDVNVDTVAKRIAKDRELNGIAEAYAFMLQYGANRFATLRRYEKAAG